MTPEFSKRLARAQRLYVRELMDGCNDCRAIRGLCPEHGKEIEEAVLHPKECKALQEILGLRSSAKTQAESHDGEAR